MQTTVGQLVANLFNQYACVYRDDAQVALATQRHVNEVIRSQARSAGVPPRHAPRRA